jgi:hypothetical protein
MYVEESLEQITEYLVSNNHFCRSFGHGLNVLMCIFFLPLDGQLDTQLILVAPLHIREQVAIYSCIGRTME